MDDMMIIRGGRVPDGDATPPAPAMSTPTMAMPTDKTCDPYKTQDGGTAKPFFKTLESRRPATDPGTPFDTAGKFGGPNAQ